MGTSRRRTWDSVVGCGCSVSFDPRPSSSASVWPAARRVRGGSERGSEKSTARAVHGTPSMDAERHLELTQEGLFGRDGLIRDVGSGSNSSEVRRGIGEKPADVVRRLGLIAVAECVRVGVDDLA